MKMRSASCSLGQHAECPKNFRGEQPWTCACSCHTRTEQRTPDHPGEDWRTAALLKDRTRRAIRERARAGETVSELAADYGVPVAFVEDLVAWQMFADDPTPSEEPKS